MTIRAGDIILYHAPWWARWLMTYYHAAIVLTRICNVLVIDSSWRGVQVRPLRGNYLAVRPKDASEFDGFMAGWYASRAVGVERYSFWQACRILVEALLDLLRGDRLKATAYACSPLVVQAWREVGVEVAPQAVRGCESPDDIAAGDVEFVEEGAE